MSNEAELRTAIAAMSGQGAPPDKNVFVWLWEAIQGDFNEDRSAGQIAFDAAVSFIPIVDQVCDVRDLIANCRAIANSDEKADNTWKWVALALTLIGLFPSLGSLVKGVLKIFFLFVRRYGADQLVKAVDHGMTWVIAFLRKRDVQRLIAKLQIDDIFKWLAEQIKAIKGKVNVQALLGLFDKAIGTLQSLLSKISHIPGAAAKAKATLDTVRKVRNQADAGLAKALAPVQKVLDTIIQKLELQSLVQRQGILDAKVVHFHGALPESRAVTLMREAEPPPSWLNKGTEGRWTQASASGQKRTVDAKAAEGWPSLAPHNIRSFHTLAAVEIKGPARLYRVTSPSNGAMGDCWLPEDVWNKITALPPDQQKAAWRKYLAVWPDWNPNGQFVVYEVKSGENLKVWRGPASSQTNPQLKERHLEGGWDQLIVKPKDIQNDTFSYWLIQANGELKATPLTRAQVSALPAAEQQRYVSLRDKINQPEIRGPFDTGWGATDFETQLSDLKLGLPRVRGQETN